MRMYLKLLVLVLLTLGLQWSITDQWRRSEWAFAVRCQYARVTRNDDMFERLVREAGERLLRQREQADFDVRQGPE